MDLASHAYSEKRNFIRMKIDTPVDVTILSESETIHGTCRDLSGGGMLIEIDKVLPVGTELEVSLASSHGHHPMLQATAMVARVISSQAGSCTLGLEIVEMKN